MAKQEDENTSPLKGTFFDTFNFASFDEDPPELEKEEEEDEKKEEPKEEPKKEEPKKEEPKEEEEENSDIQEQLQATYDAIKAKKEDELDDEEKQFIADFDAGELKDYKPTEETKTTEGFDTLTKSLIEEGVLEALDEEELEDSQDTFKKAINNTVEARVADWVNQIPEQYRNVIDHFQNGGDVNSYLQARQKVDYEALDYSRSDIQEALVRADLEQQGYTKDEIDEKVQDLKDLDKIEKEAKRSGQKFSKQQEARIEAENAKLQKEIEDRAKQQEQEIEDLSNTIDKMDSIAGFKLTPKRREAFKDFLFKVDEHGETAASKMSDSLEDRIKMYFMGFVNFDFADLERQVESKKTRDLSKLLSRYSDTQTKSKGTSVAEVPPEEEGFELKLPSMFSAPKEE